MLVIRDLYKSYDGRPVLQGVHLTLERGEIVAVMGPSGCGKSTLIRCINRLVEPDAGEILFEGRSVVQASAEELQAMRRRIGFVFQHFNLIRRLTVWENVAFAAIMQGLPENVARRRALDLLEQVGLADFAERRPDELSGGQQQRVGIARALMNEPDLLLWDEPTASLDPIRTQEVLEVMERLALETSAAMIIVTHEIPFALRVADRLVLMDHGRIVEAGDPVEVMAAPQSEVGRAYAKLLSQRLEPSRRRKRNKAVFAEQQQEFQRYSHAGEEGAYLWPANGSEPLLLRSPFAVPASTAASR